MTRATPPDQCWTSNSKGDLSAPVVGVPLQLIHWCVVWLVHADPRLRIRANRARLSALMGQLDDSFLLPNRVDRAFRRVCRLIKHGTIVVQPRDESALPPAVTVAEQAFWATLRAFGRHTGQEKAIRRRQERFFALLLAPSPDSQ